MVSIVIVILIIVAGLKIGSELVKLSSQQILASNSGFFNKAETKVLSLVTSIQEFLGIENSVDNSKGLSQFFDGNGSMSNVTSSLKFVSGFLTTTLMTLFFVVLWLAESINVQKLLNATILKQKHSSIKAFMKIEKDIVTFIKVKFLVSFLTGIGTGLACLAFDVSFPIFWGLFAFLINFVQMVGSFVTVILLSIFALVELDPSNQLLFFVLSITGVQVLFGSILEPVFMGKSFSINIITVLVMLMFWGFLWGIPGLIMAIPITVFIKIILDQFPGTKIFSDLISANSD